MRFATDIWLPRPRDEVFRFFSDAANLETLTPPWLNFEILTPNIVLRPGAVIDYRLRVYGIPLRWQSEISRWEPPERFVDEQRRGPYRRWVHTHTFVEERNGTRVGDAVEFEVPFAWVAGRLVMRDVRRIFAFRSATLLMLFGSAPGRGPHTEDEIRAHTVGEVKPLIEPIQIVDCDPAWPQLFAREAAKVRNALGAAALRVEHVGSTSVPGLAAKPIVDMLLEVADSADEAAYVPPLEAAGYMLRIREPHWHEHRMLKGSVEGRTVHLHVFPGGCAETSRMVRFRDWLRANEADRALYERTKRDLARQEWKYMQNYADAKTAVVEEIMARAASFGVARNPMR
jgi:GrpB-like predicted nucleotidyltransferase (UPF0157 family)/ligand-binding SRPBCC domain-containing protein